MNPVTLVSSTSGDPRLRAYQDIKARIHQELLNRLNLERLTQVGQAEAEPEIRRLILDLLERGSETTPLSLSERETLITDVLNELFGLGPLEALLRDPAISDILVNRFDQVYIERDGQLELTDIVFKDDRHLLQIIERIVSSVGRRIDESSPMVDARLRGRVARQRDHPAAGARWARRSRFAVSAPTGSAPQDLVDRESLTQPMLDFLQGRRGVPPQHHRVGRHRRRQDDAAERAVELHLRRRAHRHDRGRGGTDAAAAPRRAARDAAAEHRRQGRGPAAAIWSSTRSACGPIASSSARSAATKRSTCCRR